MRHRIFKDWLEGRKMAKGDIVPIKVPDGAIYTQVHATKTMAKAQMKKVVLFKDQNLLMLMTMSHKSAIASEVRKYLALRWLEELKKL